MLLSYPPCLSIAVSIMNDDYDRLPVYFDSSTCIHLVASLYQCCSHSLKPLNIEFWRNQWLLFTTLYLYVVLSMNEY